MRNYQYKRTKPCAVTRGIALDLIENGPNRFDVIIDRVVEKLKKSNRDGVGAEDLLRLRGYERLSDMVIRGVVTKEDKVYSATDKLREEFGHGK